MKDKLPHSTASLVLGIFSILTCCCYGIVGLILGILGYFQGNKAMAIHAENPDQYEGYGNANAGKITSIIGIVLSLIMFAFYVYIWTNPEMAEQLKTWAEEQQAMQQ